MKEKEKTGKMEVFDRAPSRRNISSLSQGREKFFSKEARST